MYRGVTHFGGSHIFNGNLLAIRGMFATCAGIYHLAGFPRKLCGRRSWRCNFQGGADRMKNHLWLMNQVLSVSLLVFAFACCTAWATSPWKESKLNAVGWVNNECSKRERGREREKERARERRRGREKQTHINASSLINYLWVLECHLVTLSSYKF